jgi:hypothetical protein
MAYCLINYAQEQVYSHEEKGISVATAKIRTDHFLASSQKRYRSNQLASFRKPDK